MTQIDRLSALMTHYALTITPAPADAAQLFILTSGEVDTVMLTPRAAGLCGAGPGESLRFAAHVDWGGPDSPMLSALPDCIRHQTSGDPGMQSVVDLLCAEYSDRRCGAGAVLNRLGEVLFVRLLRAEIAKGALQVGLLAGLSDPRLARVLVAMHRAPGQGWSNGDLAAEAGLSASRFLELFRARLGQSPQAYLRQWRLGLARRDIARGDRIDAVARRFGYGSSEALNHAFQRLAGHPPTALRQRAKRA